MSVPSQTELNNAYLDLKFLADITNGGPTETFTNRRGLIVKSVSNAVANVAGSGENPAFNVCKAQKILVDKTGLSGYAFVTRAADESSGCVDYYDRLFQDGHYQTIWRHGVWANGNYEWSAYSDDGSSHSWVARFHRDGGFVVGNPVGESKGFGSINAKAVYDDNAVLTCYVIEQYLHGSIDLQKWDDLVPDREIVELDDDGNEISRTTEKRQHDRARGFAQFGVERLNIDNFTQFVVENERLPAFPGPEFWVDKYNRKMSDGDITQRLWETIEILTVFAMDARKREKQILQRIEALENAA